MTGKNIFEIASKIRIFALEHHDLIEDDEENTDDYFVDELLYDVDEVISYLMLYYDDEAEARRLIREIKEETR